MTQEVIYTGKPVDPAVEEHRLSEDVKHYQEAIAIDPENVSLYKALAGLYEELGKLDKAEQIYLKASELAPRDTSIDFSLGCIYMHQNRNEDAVQKFKRYLRHSTDRECRTEAYENLMRLTEEQSMEEPQLMEEMCDEPLGFEVENFYKSLNNWAIGAVLSGGLAIIISLFGENFDPIWGVLLIIVGILALKVKIPGMFVIFSMVNLVGAYLNIGWILIGGGILWIVMILIQIALGIYLLVLYRRYNSLPLEEFYAANRWPAGYDQPQDGKIVSSRFAVAGILMSVTAAVLFTLSFIGNLTYILITQTQPPIVFLYLPRSAVILSALALTLCIEAILSKSKRTGIAIGGVVVSGLILIGQTGFTLLAVVLGI